SDVFLITHEERLAAWALRHRMPAVFQPRSAAMAGGLMSYSGNALEVYRQAGVYTGRILKGEKPADSACAGPRHSCGERSRPNEFFLSFYSRWPRRPFAEGTNQWAA